MRRATILITLALLMLAVAGVGSAREGAFVGLLGEAKPALPQTESTQSATYETTTPETTVLEETTITDDLKTPAQDDADKPDEPVDDPGGPVGEAGKIGEGSGKDSVPGATKTGKRIAGEKPAGRSESAERGFLHRQENAGPDKGRGKAGTGGAGGQPKVAVCHSGKTLTVGAAREGGPSPSR